MHCPGEIQPSIQLLTMQGAWQLPVDRCGIKKVLQAMARIAVPGGAFCLIFTDDARIAALNRKYLYCAGPTNILTFPCSDEEPGSMYLSLDCFQRECLVLGQDPIEHLLRLLAHGFGHLAGFEHGPEMAVIEDGCMEAGLRALVEARDE